MDRHIPHRFRPTLAIIAALTLVVVIFAALVAPLEAVNIPPEGALEISGEHVVVNDDDTNKNETWDKSEEGPIDNTGLEGPKPSAKPEPTLKNFTFTAKPNICPGTLVITQTGSSANIKLWKDSKKREEFTFENPYAVPAVLGKTVTFWVEGIKPTESFDSIKFTATYSVTNPATGLSGTATGIIAFGVTRADLDIDSDNQNGTEATGYDETEDQLEFSFKEKHPGKILLENKSDVDSDGVIDSVDGIEELTGTGGKPGVAGLKLIPMRLTLEKPFNPDTAKVKIGYRASIPRLGEGIAANGQDAEGNTLYRVTTTGIRLWIKDRTGPVSGEDVGGSSGGDFIPADEEIDWLDLDPETTSKTIYVEYVDVEGSNKQYSKEDIVVEISDDTSAANGYIQYDQGSEQPLARTQSPDGVNVALLPVEVVTRDRMIAGSLRMPKGWNEKLQLRFVHKATGEDLGTYGHLLSKDQGAYLYDSDREMFNDSELASYDTGSLDSRIRTEDVIFCKRPGEEDVVEFYTVYGNVGDVEIKLILDGEEIGSIGHTLEHDEVFSGIIDYINDLVSNPPDDGGVIAAAARTDDEGLAALAAAQGGIDPLAKKALVSVFNGMGALLGAQSDSERLIIGLFDGIKQGVLDDWKLLQLLGKIGGAGGAAALEIKDELPRLLVQETLRWMNDPYKRASDIATIIHQLVENVVLEPLAQAGGDFANNFTSWGNYKKFVWRQFSLAQKGAEFAWKLNRDTTGAILQGLGNWYVDFNGRMYEGAEKTVFGAIPFGPVDPWRESLRVFYYSTGYTFGYLAEQTLLGKGIGAVAKGMSKAGGKIALSALPHAKRFVARVLPFVTKKWSSKVITTAEHDAWTVALRETQTEALEAQTRNGIPVANDRLKPVAESLDEAMERQIGNLNGKLIQEQIDSLPRLKGAVARKAVLGRLGMLSKLMGDKMDDVAAKNFVKIYERKLLLDPANGKDLFDEWIIATHTKFLGGQRPFLDQIASANSTVERLEKFLKPPNEFSPWKAGFETADDFGNTARGRLLQMHEAHHGVFKNWDNLDVIDPNGYVRHSKALDFRSKSDPGVFAEMKTTAAADPSFLREAVDRSAREVQARSGHTLEFHVYYLETNPKPNLASLLSKASELEDEFPGFIIKIIDTPSPFQHWN